MTPDDLRSRAGRDAADAAQPPAPPVHVPRRWRDWPAIPFDTYLGRIPVARRRAVLRPAAPLRLPRFRGALWHSVLGAAVKTLVCTRPPGACPPCPRGGGCPYAVLFESRAGDAGEAPLAPGSRVPAALVLDAGPWSAATVSEDREVTLDYVVIGRLDLTAVLDEAIALAGRAGLGRARVPAALVRVEDRGGSLAAAAQAAARDAASGLALALRTPLRLKASGRYLRAFDPGALARDVTFRVTLLGHHHAGLPWPAPWPAVASQARAARLTEVRTAWVEGVRYSARQGRSIVLGGLVGRAVLAGVGTELAWALGAATVLHAGKGAAVGLGECRITATGAGEGIT